MVDWAVSQSDIEKHPKYREDATNLESILWSYGINTHLGFYKDERDIKTKPENWPEGDPHFGYTHRSQFTGEVSNGARYVGEARSDGKWRRFVSDFA